MNWYDKYIDIPFKHLGSDPDEGLDCFNLCKYIIESETGVTIPYYSFDFCNIVDEHWYNKTTESFFDNGIAKKEVNWNWEKVQIPQPLDVILLSIGSTNIVNHSALYVGKDKMIQTTIGNKSWLSPYGRYYKQYTVGVYRWIPLTS